MSDSFSDWTARLAEAYCVLAKIPCRRRFTDAELKGPMRQERGLLPQEARESA